MKTVTGVILEQHERRLINEYAIPLAGLGSPSPEHYEEVVRRFRGVSVNQPLHREVFERALGFLSPLINEAQIQSTKFYWEELGVPHVASLARMRQEQVTVLQDLANVLEQARDASDPLPRKGDWDDEND